MDFVDDPDLSLPEDLLSFDAKDLLGLDEDADFDIDSLFSEVPFSPQLSDTSASWSPESGQRRSGYSVSSDDPPSPNSSSSGVLSCTDEEVSPFTLTPLVTYAVVDSHVCHNPSSVTSSVVNSFPSSVIGQNAQPVVLHHPGLTAWQMEEEESPLVDSEIHMESDDDDDCDPLFGGVTFSGNNCQTLPTYFTVGNQSSNNFANLTQEERQLLAKEGIKIPENVPLTKMEERALRKVRRKIRNKTSAQASRSKKKDYVKCLEQRVKKCTESNFELQQKVETLQMQNKTLMQQLSALQTLITNKIPAYPQTKTAQATTGTCLMMVVFSVCLLVFPSANPFGSPEKEGVSIIPYHVVAESAMNSRTLLTVEPRDRQLAQSGDETEFQFKVISAMLEVDQNETDESWQNNAPVEDVEYGSAVPEINVQPASRIRLDSKRIKKDL
jgi:hypothetical protein